jgi:dolichyl-diphosphooligosaccharide--protein glycosyltransferase
VGPLGLLLCFFDRTDSKYFAIIYTTLSYYFSKKMVRLVLLLSPGASVVSGMAIWTILELAISPFLAGDKQQQPQQPGKKGADAAKAAAEKAAKKSPKHMTFKEKLLAKLPVLPLPLQRVLGGFAILVIFVGSYEFAAHCFRMAPNLSEPQIITRANSRDGNTIILDDFRQAYWWLRDNTPADARVMAWWDYGYQINGIANRTTIADGNTWNHEHIALLGRTLISPEEEAHKSARHLADYVLVWTTRYVGMYGDDLAKMPHLANIAGSVYKEINPSDYYPDQNGGFSAVAKNSLLYKLSVYKLTQEKVVLTKFEEAYSSPYKMVRIYKVKDVAPRTPHGKYSPALKLGQFKQKH